MLNIFFQWSNGRVNFSATAPGQFIEPPLFLAYKFSAKNQPSRFVLAWYIAGTVIKTKMWCGDSCGTAKVWRVFGITPFTGSWPSLSLVLSLGSNGKINCDGEPLYLQMWFTGVVARWGVGEGRLNVNTTRTFHNTRGQNNQEYRFE